MEEVKSPNNEVSEKISEIIRGMGIEFFMNEKSLLIIDSYESKGKLYTTVVNAVGHLTIDSLLKKSIMDSFNLHLIIMLCLAIEAIISFLRHPFSHFICE